MSTLQFSSKDEELEYWKNQANIFKEKYEQEAESYQENLVTSQEIEKELESQLQIAETERDQYKGRYEQASLQLENIQMKLAESTKSFNARVNYLENELAVVQTEHQTAMKQIRSLEQQNDQLERTNRTTQFSLDEFESKLNMALEKNALLENDLVEQETYKITIQRLKDEARDLKAELNARQRANSQIQAEWVRTNSVVAEENLKRRLSTRRSNEEVVSQSCEQEVTFVASSTDSATIQHKRPNMLPTIPDSQACNSFHNMGDVVSSTDASCKTNDNDNLLMMSDISPSSRITALNMISDLLAKINRLENKLSTLYSAYGTRISSNADISCSLQNGVRLSPSTNTPNSFVTTTTNGLS